MEKFGNKKMKFVSVAIRIDLQVKLKFSLFSKFKAASQRCLPSTGCLLNLQIHFLKWINAKFFGIRQVFTHFFRDYVNTERCE